MDRQERITMKSFPETVLMTTDTVGGVWTYALELAGALGERGVRVVLAAMGEEPSDAQRAGAEAIDTLQLESRPYKLEWMQDPWEDVRASGEWLLDLEAAYGPDVIHLNGYAHGALPWSKPVLTVGHSCVYSWFNAVRGGAPPGEWERYREEVSHGLRSADAVTAPTQAMLREMRRHYGSFRSVDVVYNARRMEAFRPLEREPFVLAAGRLWDEAKNMNTLDSASRLIEWPVFAAGPVENPEGGEIRFEALRLLGTLSPDVLGEWMGRASIYALPARYEPFGLTALEAAHAGCALILGDIPTLREIWEDAAVFVPPNDRDAIAGEITALAADPDRLSRMSRRAVRRAAEFSVERMTEAYLRIYAGLMRRSDAARRDRAPRAPQLEPSTEDMQRIRS